MFEGLADRLQGKTTPTTIPKQSPSKSGSLFSGLGDRLLAENKQPQATSQPTAPVIQSSPPAPHVPIVAVAKPTVKIGQGTIQAPEPGFLDKPGFISGAVNTVKEGFNDAVQRGVDLTNAIAPSGQYNPQTQRYETSSITPGQRMVAAIRAGVGAVNLAFAPISALFKGASDIQTKPGDITNIVKTPVKFAAKVANKAFETVGNLGSAGVGKVFEQLPQSEAVQQFKPVAQEIGSLAAVLAVGKAIHETSKLPSTIKEMKTKVAGMNDVVTSAAKILDVPTEKNVIGQIKKVDPQVIQKNYRELAHETHPDRGGTAQEFQVVSTAKTILEDYNTLSKGEFQAKYRAPLEEAHRVVKQILETTSVEQTVTPSVTPAISETKSKGIRTANPKEDIINSDTSTAQRPAQGQAIVPTKQAPVAPASEPVKAIASPKSIETPKADPVDEVNALIKYADQHIRSSYEKYPDRYQMNKDLKGRAMELAAVKRGLSGNSTPIEVQNAWKYLRSNYSGKQVEVEGMKGIVTQPSFGRIGVKFEDGSVKFFDPGKITRQAVTDQHVKEHLRKQAQVKLESMKKFYTGFTPPEAPKTIPQVIQEAPVPEVKAETPVEAQISDTVKDGNIDQPAIEPSKNKQLNSAVYDRLKAENPNLKDDVTYEQQNLKENADKAVELIATDKQKAYRIAMGAEEPPSGQTSTAINIALAEKAFNEGNHELYAKLTRNRSLEQTRRGQEIVAEKGSVSDNSTSRYVKELIKLRLDKVGNGYLADLKDTVSKERATPSQRATKVIDEEVKRVKEKIKSTKELDLDAAQSFLDSLACK